MTSEQIKKLYHGTMAQFSQFDHGRIGQHATGEGFGFYFTDSESLATSYANGEGFLITAEVVLHESLSLESLTIPYTEFKRFLQLLDSDGTGFLSNWGDVAYDGYENVLELASESEYETSENDVELISGIINAGCHSMGEIYELIFDLWNIDHTYIKNWGDLGCNVYVVFNTNQIEIIHNESLS